jgi:adenosylcobinamide kinase/adenosylcobinamide-phosphate guanylyltransferase
MGELILITGGSRSGKSAFGEQLAAGHQGPHLYLATCPRLDDAELAERIDRHRRDREGKGWRTVEESLELIAVMQNNNHTGLILIDCLALWVNNLLFAAQNDQQVVSEDHMTNLAVKLGTIAINHPATVIMVSNEVGMGIVPENEQARRYRDLLGRCNQEIARQADRVYLVCAGIPMQLKPATP